MKNQEDFGELELLEVNNNDDESANQLTQVHCPCGNDCSGIFLPKRVGFYINFVLNIPPRTSLSSCDHSN